MADYVSTYTGAELDAAIGSGLNLSQVAASSIPIKDPTTNLYRASPITEDDNGCIFVNCNLTVPANTIFLGKDGASISGAGREIQTTTAGGSTALFVTHKYDETGSGRLETPILGEFEDVVVNSDNSSNSPEPPFSFQYTASFSRFSTGITFESPDTGHIEGTIQFEGPDGPVVRTLSADVEADTPTRINFKPVALNAGDVIYWTIEGVRLKGTGTGLSFLPAATLHTYRLENKQILTEDDLDIIFSVEARNKTGSTIPAFTPVILNAYNNEYIVQPATTNNVGNPAIDQNVYIHGIVPDAVADEETTVPLVSGVVSGVELALDNYDSGTYVYMSDDGAGNYEITSNGSNCYGYCGFILNKTEGTLPTDKYYDIYFNALWLTESYIETKVERLHAAETPRISAALTNTTTLAYSNDTTIPFNVVGDSFKVSNSSGEFTIEESGYYEGYMNCYIQEQGNPEVAFWVEVYPSGGSAWELAPNKVAVVYTRDDTGTTLLPLSSGLNLNAGDKIRIRARIVSNYDSASLTSRSISTDLGSLTQYPATISFIKQSNI